MPTFEDTTDLLSDGPEQLEYPENQLIPSGLGSNKPFYLSSFGSYGSVFPSWHIEKPSVKLTAANQISRVLRLMAERLATHRSTRDSEVRHYGVPLSEAFKAASFSYPSIAISANVMAGAPCVAGTRIPVYMILDALEAGETLEAALDSYPQLNEQQIRDALGFAKLGRVHTIKQFMSRMFEGWKSQKSSMPASKTVCRCSAAT